MVLAVLLALIVFVAGPTLFILNLVPAAVGDYARDLAEMSSRTEASVTRHCGAWMSGWTIFYWAWWVSWTPFVGMFIARISRGRTIRQFVTGVLLVPSHRQRDLVLHLRRHSLRHPAQGRQERRNPARRARDNGRRRTLLSLRRRPLRPGQEPEHAGLGHHWPVIVLAMVLVAIFFITGADSASIVMGSLSSNGRQRTRRGLVVFWGLLTGGSGRRHAAGRRRRTRPKRCPACNASPSSPPCPSCWSCCCCASPWSGTCAATRWRCEAAGSHSVVERAIRTGVDAARRRPVRAGDQA